MVLKWSAAWYEQDQTIIVGEARKAGIDYKIVDGYIPFFETVFDRTPIIEGRRE